MATDAGPVTVKIVMDRSELDEALAQIEAARSRLLDVVKLAGTMAQKLSPDSTG
jgi:hypothetical protein